MLSAMEALFELLGSMSWISYDFL